MYFYISKKRLDFSYFCMLISENSVLFITVRPCPMILLLFGAKIFRGTAFPAFALDYIFARVARVTKQTFKYNVVDKKCNVHVLYKDQAVGQFWKQLIDHYSE